MGVTKNSGEMLQSPYFNQPRVDLIRLINDYTAISLIDPNNEHCTQGCDCFSLKNCFSSSFDLFVNKDVRFVSFCLGLITSQFACQGLNIEWLLSLKFQQLAFSLEDSTNSFACFSILGQNDDSLFLMIFNFKNVFLVLICFSFFFHLLKNKPNIFV